MAVLPLVVYPDKRLRNAAREVPVVDEEVRRQLDSMVDTLYQRESVALSAPQVGIPKRMIVVDLSNAPSEYEDEFDDDFGDEYADEYDDDFGGGEEQAAGLMQLVNPVIVEASGEVLWTCTCLSLPGVREDVKRPAQLVVEALDREGKRVRIEASGQLAVSLQQNIELLDGKLLIDLLDRGRQDMVKKRLQRSGG